MSLDTFNVVRPNQALGTGDPLALAIAEYTGLVEGTINRRSVLSDWIPARVLKGTTTAQNYAITRVGIQAVVPGVTPDGTGASINKNSVTVDTHILARSIIPALDAFQTAFDVRHELAKEQGKEIAKFRDQAFFIQAAKAAAASGSSFGAVDGFTGGTTVTLTGSPSDPAAVEAAIVEALEEMSNKDVDLVDEDGLIVLRNDLFYALLQSEHVINGQYVTANGTKVENGYVFKSYGVPVVKSNNLPQGVITGHRLSNARNSNAYDGDFSNLGGVLMTPSALLAAATIPVRSVAFYDEISKSHYVDTETAFGVAANRNEYAARILLP